METLRRKTSTVNSNSLKIKTTIFHAVLRSNNGRIVSFVEIDHTKISWMILTALNFNYP